MELEKKRQIQEYVNIMVKYLHLRWKKHKKKIKKKAMKPLVKIGKMLNNQHKVQKAAREKRERLAGFLLPHVAKHIENVAAKHKLKMER